MHKSSFKRIVNSLQLSPLMAVYLLIYSAFLTFLPWLLSRIVPCLADLNGDSYGYDVCNVDLVLRYYSLLSLSALGILLVGFYISVKRRSYLMLLSLGLALVTLAILGFYFYIPMIEERIVTIPRFAAANVLERHAFIL